MKRINKWTKQEEEFAILSSETQGQWVRVDFDLFDKKNRQIGVGYSINVECLRDFTEEEAQQWESGSSFGLRVYYGSPGIRYVLHTSAYRAGTPFGPSFNRTYHATHEAAIKAADRYVKNARKRAEKEAAKAAQP